jgi:hypothetical protein
MSNRYEIITDKKIQGQVLHYDISPLKVQNLHYKINSDLRSNHEG